MLLVKVCLMTSCWATIFVLIGLQNKLLLLLAVSHSPTQIYVLHSPENFSDGHFGKFAYTLICLGFFFHVLFSTLSTALPLCCMFYLVLPDIKFSWEGFSEPFHGFRKNFFTIFYTFYLNLVSRKCFLITYFWKKSFMTF